MAIHWLRAPANAWNLTYTWLALLCEPCALSSKKSYPNLPRIVKAFCVGNVLYHNIVYRVVTSLTSILQSHKIGPNDVDQLVDSFYVELIVN